VQSDGLRGYGVAQRIDEYRRPSGLSIVAALAKSALLTAIETRKSRVSRSPARDHRVSSESTLPRSADVPSELTMPPSAERGRNDGSAGAVE
jgi:hypothetical protein